MQRVGAFLEGLRELPERAVEHRAHQHREHPTLEFVGDEEAEPHADMLVGCLLAEDLRRPRGDEGLAELLERRGIALGAGMSEATLGVDVDVPLGVLTVVTGVAGSGIIVSALLCVAMMAAMMFAMPGGHGHK